MESAEMKRSGFTKKDTALVKGVAIIMMMFHHSFWDKDIVKAFHVTPQILSFGQLITLGKFCKLCVALFVFLSAYGMTISLKRINPELRFTREQITGYLKRRYFNLMKGWLFVFAFCEIYAWFYEQLQTDRYGDHLVQSIVYFIIDGLGLADLFGTPLLVRTWWYMSLATVIIAIFPLLVMLYRKVGTIGFLIFAVVFPRVIDIQYEPLMTWFLVIAMGIVFADKNLLARMREFNIVKNRYFDKLIKLVVCVYGLYVCIHVREYSDVDFFYELRHGLMCIYLIYMINEFISPIKYLNSFLRFVGKYSMDMFLIHTFIRGIFYQDFIYGFKYPLLIMLVLFSLALGVSILIELVKRLCGYNKLMERLGERICR